MKKEDSYCFCYVISVGGQTRRMRYQRPEMRCWTEKGGGCVTWRRRKVER